MDLSPHSLNGSFDLVKINIAHDSDLLPKWRTECDEQKRVIEIKKEVAVF